MGEVRECCFDKHGGTNNVHIILGFEILWSELFQGKILSNSCVVDNDVDLEFARFGMGEVVFGGGDYEFRAGCISHIGLDGDNFNIMLGLKGGG